ncbi:hypothetical protein Tco_0218729 [Tanacetum coccineum]
MQDGIGGYDWSFQVEEGITNFSLMAYTSQGSSSLSSSDSKVHTCSKYCLKSYEALQKQYDQQRKALNKSNLEIIGYQIRLESLEARIVVHEKNEVVYEEYIAFLKYDVQVKDISIKDLKNQLEEALKEKDDLKLKLEKFETSSMKLTKLINSQISVNNKSGVGFDSQMNKNELHDCHLNKSEVFKRASDSSVNEIEEENNQVNDRFKKVDGYHAVPPPYTGNYMPSKPDLSFAGLDDSVYKTKVSKTISSVPRIESTASKSSKDSLGTTKDVRAYKASPRAIAAINRYARHVNTAALKPKVNVASPIKYSYFKAHSPVRRAFNQKSAAKTNNLNEKVKTARVNNVTTAGSKALVNAAIGNGENSVKSSACWIWRLTGKVIDHISKDSGSLIQVSKPSGSWDELVVSVQCFPSNPSLPLVLVHHLTIEGGAGFCKLPSGHGYRGIGLWEMVRGEL